MHGGEKKERKNKGERGRKTYNSYLKLSSHTSLDSSTRCAAGQLQTIKVRKRGNDTCICTHPHKEHVVVVS